MILRWLALCLCLFAAPVQADEKLTQAELTELITQVEALLGASGDFAESEALAQQLYGLVVQDFGAETRQALEVERLIVAAAVSQSQGDRAENLGRQMMEKAIRLLPASDPLGYRCAAIFGSALKMQGNYDESLGFLSETLAEADKNLPEGDQAIIEVLLVQAAAAQVAERSDVAEAAYLRLDKILAPREDAEAKAMRPIVLAGYAKLLAEYGDPELAAEAFKAALKAMDEQFASLPRPHMMPVRLGAVVALGEVLIRLGRRDEAQALVTPDMAQVAEVYGDDSPIWADLAYVRAVSLVGTEAGAPGEAEALDLMAQIVAIQELAYDPNTVVLQRSRLNYAVLLAATGQGEAALEQLQKLNGRTEAGDRSQVVYILYSLMAAGTITQDRAVEAALNWLQDSQSGGAAASQRLLSARIAAGSDAGAALLRERTDLRGRLTATRADLSTVMSQSLTDRDPAVVQALRDEINRLSDAESALRDRIAVEAPKLADALVPAPLNLDEIRRRLGPDAALVVIDPPRHAADPGLVVAVSAEAVEWHTFQTDGPTVEAAAASLRQGIDLRLGLRSAAALDDSAPAPAAFDLEAAHFLYTETFGQVAGVLQGKRLIYVDLRGVMSALPPQLLVASPPQSDDLAQADWLIRHHAIAILPALSGLPTPQAAPPAAPQTLLAFADPDFASLSAAAPTALRGALAPLPETATEATDVAHALGAAADAVLLGANASEAAVKTANLQSVGTLYFATHGLVSGDQVGEGQALAEPALALTAGQGEDGFLTASEIAELHLNAGLVVLSACNTAVGDTPGADSLSGLAQSFLYAGARGLMVSHWPVESHSAVALMTDLFRIHAAQPGQPLAVAQQGAIVNLLDNPTWSHPAYWAPFVVVGNPD